VWALHRSLPMPARAMWKGTIAFGDTAVPVKVYSAVQEQRVHFRLLHAADGVPVEQKMVHPLSGEPVAAEDVHRGLEVERGTYVIMQPEELEALTPEADRTIRITRFVAPEEIDDAWYARPYYLGPDGDEEGYFALAEALADRGVEGVAIWTMRKKRYAGALREQGGHLILVAMRRAEEVVELPSVRPSARDRPAPEETALAEQLVGALEGEFQPEAWRDEHRERVRELVGRRAQGEEVEFPPTEEAAEEAPSLAEALKAGIEAAREARSG
jgi:DNA end-binding protein Ku